uniref:Claudin n=1 Tax=Poecilia latipinna TaxID=48699 RepID=A0A3B3UFE3_9TELE
RGTVCGAVGVTGLLGVIACCVLPRWRVSAYTGSTNELVIFDGLWMSCVKQDTKQHCKVHNSTLDLPFDLQAAGPLTIISCVLSVISLFILFFDANFITCEQNKDARPKITLAAVGLQMAGLLVIIPVSWVAHTTVRDSYNPKLLNVLKRELGVCIYIGWAAGVLMILTGVLLCCLSRPRSSCSGGTTSYYSNRASAANNDVI